MAFKSLCLNSTAKVNVSEILQLVEIKDLLIAPALCHFHGMMEYWNNVLKRKPFLLESGINDPFAIFLTLLMLSIVDYGVKSVSWSKLGIFFSQIGLGALFGLGGGLALAWLVDRV
jgi:hypothetical protein